MSFKTTGILAAVFIVLLGYLYFYEMKGKASRERAADEAKRVVQVDPEQVTRVTVRRRDTTVVAVKEEASWQILEPVRTEGDGGNLDMLVRSVRDLEAEDVVADSASVAGGEVDPADFGLGDPAVVVTVVQAGGVPDTIFWGDKSPTGSYVYLRRSGSPEILAANSWRRGQAEKGLYDLRDRRVMPFEKDQVRKVEIAYDGRTIVASKEAGAWRLEQPVADRGDGQAIDKLLNRLHVGRARHFAAEAAPDLSPYGLAAPWMSVTITEREGLVKKTVTFGDSIRDGRFWRYYGKYGFKAPVFTVDSTLVADLKKTPSDLRYKEIFAFDRAGIDRVTLAFSDTTVDCRRDTSGTAWEVVTPAFHTVDAGAMTRLIDKVNALKADRFVAEALDAPEQYGLDDPAFQVKLYRGETVVREVALGRKDGKLYARGDARPQVVEVKGYVVDDLKRLELKPAAPGMAVRDTAGVGGAEGVEK